MSHVVLTSSGKQRRPEVRIDNDVPLPTTVSGRYSRWPFGRMKVGSSIRAATRAEYIRMRSAKQHFIESNRGVSTKDFLLRQTEDGWRCWRVK